mgnify:CR=1 FL=1
MNTSPRGGGIGTLRLASEKQILQKRYDVKSICGNSRYKETEDIFLFHLSRYCICNVHFAAKRDLDGQDGLPEGNPQTVFESDTVGIARDQGVFHSMIGTVLMLFFGLPVRTLSL